MRPVALELVRRVLISSVLFCSCLHAVPVRADAFRALPSGSRVALLPTTQAPALSLPNAQREEATRALISALRKRGYDVVPTEQVNATLDKRAPDGCRDAVTCDPELALQTLQSDAVISLALWQHTGAEPRVLVYVRRKQSYGQAELVVDKTGIASTATRALEQALADTERRHDVRVRIESEPAEATVRVDQSPVGPSPATLDLAPGNHLVTIETPGYVTATRFIEVPTQSEAPVVHKIVLERTLAAPQANPQANPQLTAAYTTGDTAASSAQRDIVRPNRPANYVLAAVLGAVAIPLLANAIYTGAHSGTCEGNRDPEGRCSKRAALGLNFWTSLVLGSAALSGGGVVLVVQPLRSHSEQLSQSTELDVRGTF